MDSLARLVGRECATTPARPALKSGAGQPHAEAAFGFSEPMIGVVVDLTTFGKFGASSQIYRQLFVIKLFYSFSQYAYKKVTGVFLCKYALSVSPHRQKIGRGRNGGREIRRNANFLAAMVIAHWSMDDRPMNHMCCAWRGTRPPLARRATRISTEAVPPNRPSRGKQRCAWRGTRPPRARPQARRSLLRMTTEAGSANRLPP